MPTFTMELWRVIDLKPDSVEEDTWLGLAEYPIFAAAYREGLNKKIKDHFMYQEIGHETVEQFTFSMKRKMNEIMPLYNQLYESEKFTYDPLSTMDIRTVATGTQAQTSEGSTANDSESDVDSKARNVASNFPQQQLRGNADYASSGADSNSQTATKGKVTEESTAANNANSESDSHTTGYQGIPSQLLQAYRSAILNIDMMIIAELDTLFMAVWNNGDEYTGRRF